MQFSNDIYNIFISSLFILAVLLVPLGLSFLLIPEKTLRVTANLNRWISTEHIFDIVNKPRYQERFIYRHHRIFGITIIALTTICLYMLLFYMDNALLLKKIMLLADTVFGQWLLESFYYIFIVANILVFIIGIIIFIRPSMLKSLERKANHWIETDNNLKFLDRNSDLPESIFHKYPRLLGVIIIIGAIWIMINTKSIFM